MNYYERHIGDYQTATADLSLLEHGAYSMLLDSYYSREKPLPAEPSRLYQICKALNKSERAAVDLVVARFFALDGDILRNERCDIEIEKFHQFIDKQGRNGKLGGRPRKFPNTPKPKQNPTETQPQTQTITQTKAPTSHLPINTPLPPKGDSPSAGISKDKLSDPDAIERWAKRQAKTFGWNPDSVLTWLVAAGMRSLDEGDDPVGFFIHQAKRVAGGDTAGVGDEWYDAAKRRMRDATPGAALAETNGVERA